MAGNVDLIKDVLPIVILMIIGLICIIRIAVLLTTY